jgi:acetyl-CoA acetyltransferase
MVEDLLLADGLTDAFDNIHMGVCAEHTAAKQHITRAEQDEYALRSYAKATAAATNGTFAKEIVPVEIKSRRGTTVVDTDEEYKNLVVEKVSRVVGLLACLLLFTQHTHTHTHTRTHTRIHTRAHTHARKQSHGSHNTLAPQLSLL